MNPSVISALAALAGAAIGGLTSILASWWAQHAQAKAQWLMQDKQRRQELYKEFIEEASKSMSTRSSAIKQTLPPWACAISARPRRDDRQFSAHQPLLRFFVVLLARFGQTTPASPKPLEEFHSVALHDCQ